MALGQRDHMHTRSRPSRLLGFTLSKNSGARDFQFDEPIDLSAGDDIDAILEQKTGKSRAQWNEEGYIIGVNGS